MKFTAIGECLLEFAQINQSNYKLSFAGDTFNTCYYMNKLGKINTHYVTAVGTDSKSAAFLNFLKKSDIATDQVSQIPEKFMGLYLIENDECGERHFQYYRQNSAAKELVYQMDDNAIDSITNSNIIYLSGITLAILDDNSKKRLYDILSQAKMQGAKIAFDNNYRPILWKNKQQALKTLYHFHVLCDLLFATFDDEKNLFDDIDVQTTIKRYLDSDIATVIIKDGEHPCHVIDNRKHYTFPTKTVDHIIDTTGAGDSFNAGFIHARLMGENLSMQIATGQRIAEKVIQTQGALTELTQLTALPA